MITNIGENKIQTNGELLQEKTRFPIDTCALTNELMILYTSFRFEGFLMHRCKGSRVEEDNLYPEDIRQLQQSCMMISLLSCRRYLGATNAKQNQSQILLL